MAELEYKKEKTLLTISLSGLEGLDTICISFYSIRNGRITKVTDIAPGDKVKDRYDHLRKKYPLHEIYLPVVDMELEKGMKAVAEFSGSGYGGEEYCLLNKMFRDCRKPLDKKVTFDAEDLEHWENQLFADSRNTLDKFYILKEYKVDCLNHLCCKFILLSEKWSGEITVSGTGKDGSAVEIGNIRINDDRINQDIYTAVKPASMKRERVVEALSGAIGFLQRSQCKNQWSKAYNGLYLNYDYDERIYRHPTWIWTWGIAIRAILDAGNVDELDGSYDKGYLVKLADEIGRASLKFQMLDKAHPAHGMLMCRYDADLQYEEGSSGFLSPADGLFMAGYGWMPLYNATGDEKYLHATKLMVDETERLLKSYDVVIEQDYVTAEKEWKDWVMDESAFGMIGFLELYRILPEVRIQNIAADYMGRLLSVFERGDGFWNRIWWKSVKGIERTSYNTKGFGWAMIGLLNSYKLFGERRYLEKAKKMADNLIDAQQKDGKWYMFIKGSYRKDGNGGICEKSTALWSFLLYELYEVTGDRKYLDSARKAIFWCMGHQYCGTDQAGQGAIPVCSLGSGLNFRPYFNMCTSYGVSFMAAALAKELKISGRQH